MNTLKSEKPFKVLKVQSTPTSPASINTFNHSKYSKFYSTSLASLNTLSSLKTLSSLSTLNAFIRNPPLLIGKKIAKQTYPAACFVLDIHYGRPKKPVLKALSRFTLDILSDVAGNLRQFSVSEGGFCGNFIYAIILLKGIVLSHLTYKLRVFWGLTWHNMALKWPFIPHLLEA